MLKKEFVFKTYNETNCDEVISLLEEEIIEEKSLVSLCVPGERKKEKEFSRRAAKTAKKKKYND